MSKKRGRGAKWGGKRVKRQEAGQPQDQMNVQQAQPNAAGMMIGKAQGSLGCHTGIRHRWAAEVSLWCPEPHMHLLTNIVVERMLYTERSAASGLAKYSNSKQQTAKYSKIQRKNCLFIPAELFPSVTTYLLNCSHL